MAKSLVRCSIQITAPSREALAVAIQQLIELHGERLQNLRFPHSPTEPDSWMCCGELLAEVEQKPVSTEDDKSILLLMAGIAVLCSLNLILLNFLFSIPFVYALILIGIAINGLVLASVWLQRAKELDQPESELSLFLSQSLKSFFKKELSKIRNKANK